MSVDLIKNKKFDVQEFNKSFQEQADAQKEINKKHEASKEKEMSYEIKEKKLLDMTIREIMIDWKISIDGILNDFQARHVSKKTFTTDNRLFHLGMTILIGVLFFYLMKTILSSNSDKRVVNEYHIVTPT